MTDQVEITQEFFSSLRGWLADKMAPEMPWLLVHADDGVIWGRRTEDGKLIASSDVFGDKSRYPEIAVDLRVDTLQQVRVFGPAGELFIWRSGESFAGRSITDGPDTPENAFEEKHLLWGQGAQRVFQQDFTLLAEGQQGPRHAVPLVVDGKRRPALRIRHYVDYDGEGQAFVHLSRLVDLLAE
jgi:CRISPR-associated protein (TIGR03984 family)